MTVFNEHPRATIAVVAVLLLIAGVKLFRHHTQSLYTEEIAAYYQDMAIQLETVTEGLPPGANLVVLELELDLRIGDKGQFRKVLGNLKKKGFSVLHVEPLIYSREAGWDGSKQGFPYSEYRRVVEEFGTADAVVSLCGLPYGFSKTDPKPGADLPLLLAINTHVEDRAVIERLVKKGWIQAALAARERDAQGASSGGDYVRVH